MAYNLTVAITVTNAGRLAVGTPVIDDDNSVMVIPIFLKTTIATNIAIARADVWVRNGVSDQLRRGPTVVGVDAGALLFVAKEALSTPTGFDQCLSAYKGAVGAANTRLAMEAVLKTLNVFDPGTLAGT